MYGQSSSAAQKKAEGKQERLHSDHTAAAVNGLICRLDRSGLGRHARAKEPRYETRGRIMVLGRCEGDCGKGRAGYCDCLIREGEHLDAGDWERQRWMNTRNVRSKNNNDSSRLRKTNLFAITAAYQLISPCDRQGCRCYAKYAHLVPPSERTSWLRSKGKEALQVKGQKHK